VFEILLLDLDDTILDFQKAEHIAVSKTFRAFDINPTEAVCSRYSQINKLHWEALERGELTRQQVLEGRFQALFDELGVCADAAACAKLHEKNLCQVHYFLPGAKEALERLAKKYRLFLVSNGTAVVQAAKLKNADLKRFFEDVFISQQMGADKPALAFFQRCFARIRDFDPAKTMIVGDSLTSDIRGGINAGITTCWVNPDGKPARADIPADYTIERLAQLEALLNSLQ